MIRLRNVRVNNLDNVDLDIDKNELLLMCGVSGSGKSSLAFDTLYAEGQRRYIECLAPQTRQFISQLDKPDADLLEGIPPAIAVRAFRGAVNRKTTVGNATEIAEHLRLLFVEAADVVCPECNIPVLRDQPESVAAQLAQLSDGTRYQIVFRPADYSPGSDADWATALMAAAKNGFARATLGDSTIDLSRPDSAQIDAESNERTIRVIVDRLSAGGDLGRITESLEVAFQSGNGSCEVLVACDVVSDQTIEIDGRLWEVMGFSNSLACGSCGRVFEPPSPKLFSHNHKAGACTNCDGLGFTDRHDREKCTDCEGQRLRKDALAFQLAGNSIADLAKLPLNELAQRLLNIELPESAITATRWLREQIENRLKYLCQVGLGYISLDRPVRTLSAGEAQRVSLTSCLSSTLANTLYVLDEPSVGLHPKDTQRLIESIVSLHQRENTVVVVDHDEDIIRAIPRIVEIGPGAGSSGGEIVFDGSPRDLQESGNTTTADFLAERRGVSFNQENRRQRRGSLTLQGATGNNLKNVTVEFPLGCLTVVSGVSGSGKSSLVNQTLYGAVCEKKQHPCDPPLPHEGVIGESRFDEIVMVTRSPISRSARSNPVTYVKAFDDIRRCFADTVDARAKNLNVSKFSFNAAGGRCDKCEGAGQLTVNMQFMPDVSTICDQCNGTRYRDEVLAVKYRGQSISDVLNLTVRQAFTFFRGQPKVQAKLKSLIDVGLEYIRLGQPASTLSSGESQRLKLGHYLNSSKSKRTLFLLDEPTTGLHMADVTKLLDCFDTLLTVGHSLIVIEHHLRVIQSADWVIDMGPGAAAAGGQIVAAGTPEDVAKNKTSVTAKFMTF